MKFQTRRYLKAVRLNNIFKLLKLIKDWIVKYDLTLQDIELYILYQNDIAERAIQIIEISIRVIIYNTQLLIEFQDEVAIIDAYLRNRIVIDPVINDKPTSSK